MELVLGEDPGCGVDAGPASDSSENMRPIVEKGF